MLGGTKLSSVHKTYWRSVASVVSQDGYIFSDTIARNIALGEEYIDQERLLKAVKIARIERFIDRLPDGYGTLIGASGTGLSTGQRQRILIARALYHKPQYLFLDEATTGLNAFMEVLIMDDLFDYMKDTTIVIVAHRHSTFDKARHVIVLEEGRIVEQGSPKDLYAARSDYFRIVRNQTLLGN